MKVSQRQKANVWRECLNRIRVGELNPEDKKLLDTRRLKRFPNLQVDEACHVFYTNLEVDDHNMKMLNDLPNDLVHVKSEGLYPKGYKLMTTPHGTIEDTPLRKDLYLKKGARVMLTFNVSITDSLINGAVGTIIGFLFGANSSIKAIIVKFDDDWTGMEQRQKYAKYLTDEWKAQNGTPIFRMEHEYELVSRGGHGQTSRAKLLQFPLSLSYAQTCHRMQGQTVKAETKVNIHWTNGMQNGMAYVMLGRSVRRQDIYISGKLDPSQIRCDPDALEESKRLSKEFDDREAELAEKFLEVFELLSPIRALKEPWSLLGVRSTPRVDKPTANRDPPLFQVRNLGELGDDHLVGLIGVVAF